jgi:predicted DNA-binding transcriptional regulator AlpA
MDVPMPKNVTVIDAPQVSLAPDQFISIEEVARRLQADVPWIREKIRRRCPNPMPVFNLGRHLVFDWAQVVQWVRNSSRPIHAAHGRRWKQKPEGKAA